MPICGGKIQPAVAVVLLCVVYHLFSILCVQTDIHFELGYSGSNPSGMGQGSCKREPWSLGEGKVSNVFT